MNDDELRALVSDAVTDVEPADRLAAIRRRTGPNATRRSHRGGFAIGGAALAAGAAVAVAAVLAAPHDSRDGDVAANPTDSPSSTAPTRGPSDDPPAPTPAPTEAATTAVYYVGSGPDGPKGASDVLYRYFEPAAAPLDLLTATPSDPDYRTLWPAGSLTEVSAPEVGVVQVTIGDASLHDRPAGMSEREAALAVEQVVYTMQAFHQDPDLAVQFLLDGNPIDEVYGVATSEPVISAPEIATLSLMSISDPGEGLSYSSSFTARGRASSFEGTVFCRLLDAGGTAAWQQSTIAAGPPGDHLSPWRLRVDLSGVPAGTYTFTCATDDPTGGTEGRGTDVDTRTITVE